MTDDPERLVAEALRAHAARTPLPEPTAPPEPEPASETSSVLGYGLLSGGGMPLTAPVDQPTVLVPRPPERTTRLETESRVAVGWVVLLALLLGLATGAVVGLLTLL